MLRVFLILLGLGLMAAPAGLAASPRSADWMIPRPVTTPSSDRPARIIDVASVRYKWYELHRASLLNDGRLLLWESGRSLGDPGDWSISLLDAISGAIDTLWHGESNIGGKPILSADRQVAWFAAHVSPVTLSGVRDGLFVIDLQGRQIWPLDRVYYDAFKAHFRTNAYKPVSSMAGSFREDSRACRLQLNRIARRLKANFSFKSQSKCRTLSCP